MIGGPQSSPLATQVLSAQPFTRYEIPLGPAIDRSQGAPFPQIDGDFLYVERSDYPCFLSVVTPQSVYQQSIIARDGAQLMTGPFKGLTITHPSLDYPTRNLAPAMLSLIVGRGAGFTNQLGGTALQRAPFATFVNATGASLDLRIFVPIGSRKLRGFNIAVPCATIGPGPAQLIPLDGGGIGISPVNTLVGSQQFGGFPARAYNAPISPGLNLPVPALTGTVAIFNVPEFVLPTGCVELQFSVPGTTITQPAFIGGSFE